MKRIIFLFGLIFVFVATASFAEDSPLVQAAKKEKERRAKTEAKKTFTNQDIEEVRAKTSLGMESTPTEESKTAQAKKGEKKDTAESEKDKSNDEAYWKGRRSAADDRVKAAEDKVRQLQDDINSMNKAYYIDGSADGVSQQPLLADELNKRQDDIEAAKKDLDDAKGELNNLEDEARQAGAPPGWVSQ